jgi:hypothetical protein
MAEIYSFDSDLRQSFIDAGLPLWERIYSDMVFLGDFAGMRAEARRSEQLLGVDRIVTTRDGVEHRVEEKLRRNWAKAHRFFDVATELFSDVERRVIGWPYRSLGCEVFVYVRLTRDDSAAAFVWDYADLYEAARLHKTEWVRKVWNDGQIIPEERKGQDGFSSLLSPNGTHTTLGLCIPDEVIRAQTKPRFEIYGFSTAAEREQWLKPTEPHP